MVPSLASPSSLEVSNMDIFFLFLLRSMSFKANKKAEMLLFISAAPLAVITFSLISAAKGSQDHDSTGPVGTTSV